MGSSARRHGSHQVLTRAASPHGRLDRLPGPMASPTLPLKGAHACGKGTVAYRPDYWFRRLIAAGEDVGRERRLEHLRALRLNGAVVAETCLLYTSPSPRD